MRYVVMHYKQWTVMGKGDSEPISPELPTRALAEAELLRLRSKHPERTYWISKVESDGEEEA